MTKVTIKGDLIVNGNLIAVDPEGLPFTLVVDGNVYVKTDQKLESGVQIDGTLSVQGDITANEFFVGRDFTS